MKVAAQLNHRVVFVSGFPTRLSIHGSGGYTTEQKLSVFRRLEEGWSNGNGQAVCPVAFFLARELVKRMADAGFVETDAFPRSDGGVTIALYFGDDGDLSFTINPNGLVDIDSENEPDFDPIEGKSFLDVLNLFENHSSDPWSLYSSYIFPITQNAATGFTASLLKARVMAAVSQLSTAVASTRRTVQFANTLDYIIAE